MSKKSKNNKATISIKRRFILYYLRFITLLKIVIFLILVLLLFTDLLNKPKQKLRDIFVDKTAELGLVFKHLVIVGLVNITEDDIIEAIGGSYGVPIYSLSIDDIRKRIEDNPWIKMALVERKLPNTLSVTITERTPIAIWQFKQKLYLIDEEGNRISSKNIEKFGDLIHVVGQDANVYARSLYEDLEKHPSLAKKVVSAVRYGQRRWDLNLEQKINVKMPEKGFQEAYDYLNSLNKEGKLFDQNYKIINLKDPGKYYIEKHEM
ncbi:MAG: FtsQ-type POTRA domain-containing protein [Rickettsiaceae bacterium]|nr:FtsQ-type POTRA domain-containing protein [Rickettsiaceae bacterium]MCP5377504.1 FtsQ-type POTRA domain-containing protein [Rickettsiaceae bacterium]